MKEYSVRILWGSSPEPGDKPVLYEFDTEAELTAFLEGVDESNGWMDYEVVEGREEE